MSDLFPTIPSGLKFGDGDKVRAKKGQPKGYFRLPGGGPAGETCKSCKHSARVAGGSKSFWKCGLLRAAWTHGPGSDIRLKTPACAGWEKQESK